MRTLLTHRAAAWVGAGAFVLVAVAAQTLVMTHDDIWTKIGGAVRSGAVGAAAVSVAVGWQQRQRRRDWSAYAAQLRGAANSGPPRPHLRVVTSTDADSLDTTTPADSALPRAARRASRSTPATG